MTPDPINLSANLNQNFQLFAGEDKVITVDMTGYDAAIATVIDWWMATSPYALDAEGDVVIKKVLGDGIELNGTNIDITIDSIDTATVKPELYYHELKLTLADGTVKVAMTGNIVLLKSLDP